MWYFSHCTKPTPSLTVTKGLFSFFKPHQWMVYIMYVIKVWMTLVSFNYHTKSTQQQQHSVTSGNFFCHHYSSRSPQTATCCTTTENFHYFVLLILLITLCFCRLIHRRTFLKFFPALIFVLVGEWQHNSLKWVICFSFSAPRFT